MMAFVQSEDRGDFILEPPARPAPGPAQGPASGPAPKAAGEPFAADIARDRKRLLLKSVAATTAPTIAAALLVTAAFWERVAPLPAAAWLFGVVAVALFRYWTVKAAGDADNLAGIDPARLETAHRRTLLGAGLAAALWVAGTALFANGDFGDLMALSFLYMTLCCAGTVSLSVFRPAFFLFVPPIMAAMIGAVAVHAVNAPADRANAVAVTAALGLILLVFFRLMRQTDRQLGHALALNYQNLGLLDDLQDNNRRAAAESARQSRRSRTLERLAADFEGGVSAIMAATDDSARQMNAQAAETTAAAAETRRLAAETAAEVGEVSGGVRELSGMAAALSSSIGAVSRDVTEAADVARSSVERVADAQNAMAAMSDASRRIGEIVGLISVIARQTNLLALNAAIEAQRVGDAGKGFAVVAAEVKALADQTERASREVTAHIGRIQSITGDAESAIRSTLETVARIDGIAARVVGSVDAQKQTTLAIGAELTLISDRSAAAAGATRRLDDAAAQAADAADALTDVVKRLSGAVSSAQAIVEDFLISAKRLE